jgi:hypothetical protein
MAPYFPKTPCDRCGERARTADRRQCVECLRAQKALKNRAYYEANASRLNGERAQVRRALGVPERNPDDLSCRRCGQERSLGRSICRECITTDQRERYRDGRRAQGLTIRPYGSPTCSHCGLPKEIGRSICAECIKRQDRERYHAKRQTA